ncbi:MAG: hypothetical protein E7453_07030 [Ruminococcaceae bacterium]|nr:hypothetical protein [Oscillospiraceae bacterium]
MKRRALFRLLFALALAVVVVLVVSIISLTNHSEDLYAVTAQQWEAAFGDAAHIQTIYRNVTVEIGDGTDEKPMILATSGGGVLLDYEKGDMKLICVPVDNGFTSYIWRYSTGEWDTYDGKAEGVDELLAKELPNYVDTAMAGLQGEFGNASYDAEERCYSITSQKAVVEDAEPITMHCQVYFEGGKLVKLKTKITADEVLTVHLYSIGETAVQPPQIPQIPAETTG